ncbi:spore germination protein [Sporosarcina sp. G11-34]|uniref:spore germination protein n=1 Tax=Sporosarcina sp. G11-34 TaxID=2849605 RepID=UPI0022A9ECE9|nr:spore germination protein [Sporosarcina sp. G11-34]MCZ2258245.1 spore germination protein [Sporosarcina sp. G11-34]
MDQVKSNDSLILYIKNLFHDSADLIVREVSWKDGVGIVCFFNTMTESGEVNKQIDIIRKRAIELPDWGGTAASTVEAFSVPKLVESVSSGFVVVYFPVPNLIMTITIPSYEVRSTAEPNSEIVIRGAHEGFVESIDKNISLIRKHLTIPDLVVKDIRLGKDTNTKVTYIYIESIANKEVVEDVNNRLENIDAPKIYSAGQIEDYLEDSVFSPFPQFLNTERPDRVVANLLEGKIVIFTDQSPTALIAPITFFSFYESTDDFNGRVLVGTFYRILRLFSFMIAIFLPAFYIAVVGFHSEILPFEISQKVKVAVQDIPYRPLVEALIVEVFIEIIREAAIRLPAPIGPTIGIVGGLVIGDAIVNAGLVSNLMVIVVAMTAIASFVVPSFEMNMTIRIIRFPFMLAASLFGFFGIAIATLILFIHLMNQSSLKQPYLSPVVPFDPSRFKNIFFRVPYYKNHKQQQTFTHGGDKQKDGGET